MDVLIIASGLRPTGMAHRQNARHETEYYLRHGPRPAGTIARFVAGFAAVAALGGLVGFLPMLL
jgi:hypothetical protein